MLPYVLTDAEVERAALYRTLRNLERNGNVTSEWMTKGGARPGASIDHAKASSI